MTGRRDRNMQEKRQRILDAAAALFEESGFDAVTTQQISDRADVAAGTLFRYAASKGELLLMVYNGLYRAAIEEGVARASAAQGDVTEAIARFVAPVLSWAAQHPDNSTAYQRELLFGAPDEPYRSEGLELAEAFESRILDLLRASDQDGDGERVRAAQDAAHTIAAIVHLAIARTPHLSYREQDAARLRRQIDQIIHGFRAHPRVESEQQGKETP